MPLYPGLYEQLDYLDALHLLIGQRFARAEPRERVRLYLRGLLSSVERRNGWQLAAVSGEKYPDGMQRLLSSAHWNAEKVRDDLCAFIVGYAADNNSVLVIDEWRFHKKGNRSVGVDLQRSADNRRSENVQTGLFLTYATRTGRFLIDRELYLPPSWANDHSLRRIGRIPESVVYRSTAELGASMVARALAARVPVGWVGASTPWGNDQRLRAFLERHRVPFVLGIPLAARLPLLVDGRVHRCTAEVAAALVPPDAWTPQPQQIEAPNPSRRYRWTQLPLSSPERAWMARSLLLRRGVNTVAENLRGYLCYAGRGTSLVELAEVTSVIDGNTSVLASACENVGLNEYEVRQWMSWYRYTTLALAAHSCLVLAGGADGSTAHVSSATSLSPGAGNSQRRNSPTDPAKEQLCPNPRLPTLRPLNARPDPYASRQAAI
ncbi:MAG: IS701 family transposase [Pseudonocardiaceae bacterium]